MDEAEAIIDRARRRYHVDPVFHAHVELSVNVMLDADRFVDVDVCRLAAMVALVVQGAEPPWRRPPFPLGGHRL